MANSKCTPSWERVREVLHYDPETGIFTRKVEGGGHPVGVITWGPKAKYFRICIDGYRVKVQRWAWFYVHGVWPEFEVDHKNCDPKDNRLSNLRACTHSQNMKNCKVRRSNKCGYKGVCWNRHANLWMVQLTANGHSVYAAYFKDLLTAARAYDTAARKYHGEFARLNFPDEQGVKHESASRMVDGGVRVVGTVGADCVDGSDGTQGEADHTVGNLATRRCDLPGVGSDGGVDEAGQGRICGRDAE